MVQLKLAIINQYHHTIPGQKKYNILKYYSIITHVLTLAATILCRFARRRRHPHAVCRSHCHLMVSPSLLHGHCCCVAIVVVVTGVVVACPPPSSLPSSLCGYRCCVVIFMITFAAAVFVVAIVLAAVVVESSRSLSRRLRPGRCCLVVVVGNVKVVGVVFAPSPLVFLSCQGDSLVVGTVTAARAYPSVPVSMLMPQGSGRTASTYQLHASLQ